MNRHPDRAAPDATVLAYSDADDLPTARAFAREKAREHGLGPDQADAMALAVSELVTNTLQHTSAGGRLRIWADDTSVYCDVTDTGAVRTFGRAMPAPDADRGRGLALVERLCDGVTAIAEAGGTLVRVRFARDR